MRIEIQIRQAIRDAVNRNSRKPFYWGGLAGYQQLESIARPLRQVTDVNEESRYLRQLIQQVDRVLAKNRTLAEDLLTAHQWLQRIAGCLHYPPQSRLMEKLSASDVPEAALNSQTVARNVEDLIRQFHPTGRNCIAKTPFLS